jgi:2-hydroxychromene-2-carboxylate isomerase
MIKRGLVFRFDYISPYAYLAWKTVHSVAERNDCAVEPVPILFAVLLDAFGHKGPAEIPWTRPRRGVSSTDSAGPELVARWKDLPAGARRKGS